MSLDTLHGLSHLAQFGIFGVPVFVVLAILYRFARYESWVWRTSRILMGLSAAAMVLAVLGAIGDGLFSAKIVARKPSCQSNMKQLALGLLMYSKDWNEYFPSAASWANGISKYQVVENYFHCPSADSRFSYALNRAVGGRSVNDISDRAVTVLIFEMDANDRNAVGDEHTRRPKRHMGANNMAFTDGHSKSMNDYSTAKVRWTP